MRLPLVVPLLAAALGVAGAPPNVDVSRAPGPQNEVTIAADQRHPNVLLAGSNSFSEHTERVYSSTDGGRTWTSKPGPPLVPSLPVGASDPTVGIDARGRQYFSFMQIAGAGTPRVRSAVAVAARSGPHAAWRSVAVPGSQSADKPTLTTAGDRAYVVWISHHADELRSVLFSSSADGGQTWSRPVQVDAIDSYAFSYPSVAVGAGGVVYVAWTDFADIEIARSTTGGRSFGQAQSVAATGIQTICGFAIPAQPTTCVRPDPVVVADPRRHRVYVTWSALGSNGAVDVFARRLGGRATQVNPPDGRTRSDQFWPAPAVDEATGRFWVCFYDTRADPRRVKAVYSCTASADAGRTWAKPVPVASVASDETQRGAAKGDNGREYGDYEGLAVAGGVAHPIWTDSRDLKTRREEIYAASLTAAALR